MISMAQGLVLSASLSLLLLLFLTQPTAATPPTTLTIPSLPLSTKSRYIVDATGQRVKLACVNWAGAHMKDYVVGGLHISTLDQIASQIASLGFNCVRLQWSLELYWNNPVVGAEAVQAMPHLIGAKALDVYDLVCQDLSSLKKKKLGLFLLRLVRRRQEEA